MRARASRALPSSSVKVSVKRARTIRQQEKRLAIAMLTPAIGIVMAIVILPVLTNFWISVKPIALGDLRPPAPLARRHIRDATADATQGDAIVRYILRNSSATKELRDILIEDTLPPGYRPLIPLPDNFTLDGTVLTARYDRWAPGHTNTVEIPFTIATAARDTTQWEEQPLRVSADADNILSNFQFTLNNFRTVIQSADFISLLLTTIVYTCGGASGAILLGLCAALIVNKDFFARGMLRALLLFPYVAPIIAVAFTWQFLLDPLSGLINSLLLAFNITDGPIPFLSQRPTAMMSVILFDAWRYSPFAYLFILARLQAIPKELYESAMMDGAGIMRTFRSITLPHLSGIIGTIFLLRFIWTFNRFDDIFLLTGGAAGTKTLPIAVYDSAFGRNDIGGAAATAVLLFVFLSIFLIIYLKVYKREKIEV